MKITNNVPLKPFTTFKLGGNAEYFVSVTTKEELVEAITWARKTDVPFMVMGGGSNVLFSDKGFEGLVIQNQIKGYEFYEKNGSIFVGVGAGEVWDDFVAFMVRRGLYGVENLSGIPGSVGATPIQNVGAYGAEVADVISWVEALNTETLEFELFTNNQCRFGYRDSFFKTKEGKQFIVVEVGFKLQEVGTPNISYRDLTEYFNNRDLRPDLRTVRDAVLEVRKGKFPDLNRYGCGGSFFKNPIIARNHLRALQQRFPDIPHYSQENDMYKVPLAWILEHAVPWKGVRRKTIGVHDDQPLVLVHYGGGNAEEMKKLADDITHSISNELNLLISPEVQYVGKF